MKSGMQAMCPMESFAGEGVAGPYYVSRKPDELWVATLEGEFQKRIVELPDDMSVGSVFYDAIDVSITFRDDEAPGLTDRVWLFERA